MRLKSSKAKITALCLIAATVLSGMALSRTPDRANADVVDDITISVAASCSLAATGTAHSTNLTSGQTVSDIGSTTMTVTCNDTNGWAIYAVGFGGDTEGTTTLATTSGAVNTISTGTSGTDSYWAMKLAAAGTTSTDAVVSDFKSYHVVPSAFTKVAALSQDTAATSATGSSVSTTYQVHASSVQPAGEYSGKVKYVLVHPSSAVTCSSDQGLSTTTTCADLHDITVNFAGEGVDSISFVSPVNYEAQTVTASGTTIKLVEGVTYTVTTSLSAGHTLDSLSATSGTISDATANPSTYTPSTTTATFTVTGE